MRSLWAVATNTARQALRMKVAIVFIVLLAVLLPTMGLAVTGDGTLKGRLQTFVSYGLSLTTFLLSLLTISASIYTLSSDIKYRQIYTVITKPIRRSQLLVGKLLGVLMLNAALLILFSATIYGIAVYMPKYYNASEQECTKVKNEFFTARASLTPAEVDVTDEVRRTYEKLEKSGQLNELFRGMSRREIIRQLTKQKQLQKRSAAVGEVLSWKFNNVKPLDPNENLFIRFKYDVSVNPPDLQVYGRWLVGDMRQVRYATPTQTPIRQYDRKDLIRTAHEIQVPADVIADDGYLEVVFVNVPLNNTTVIFPLEKGMEVLYKADTFTANFLRAVALIFLRLVFLAILGLMTSTFLSFPVALLVCLVVFFTSSFSGFVVDSFEYLSENISHIYSYTFKPLMTLLPRFDRFNPSTYLVSARLVSWPLLAQALGVMIGIKAMVLLLFALLIFNYREIAKVTV